MKELFEEMLKQAEEDKEMGAGGEVLDMEINGLQKIVSSLPSHNSHIKEYN